MTFAEKDHIGAHKQKGSVSHRRQDPLKAASRPDRPGDAVRRARQDPASLTVRDVEVLHRLIGNQAVARLLNRSKVGPPTGATIQRVVIPHATIPGLTANLDTTQLDAAKALINILQDSGKRNSIAQLYSEIREADRAEDTANNKELMRFLNAKLELTASSAPENAQSGSGEQWALWWKYWSQTATNPVVQNGLRMWISGDPQRGINWNMIGQHLRGRLAANDYQAIGAMHHLLTDQRNNTNLAVTYLPLQQQQAGAQLLDDARADIRGALNALPDHTTASRTARQEY